MDLSKKGKTQYSNLKHWYAELGKQATVQPTWSTVAVPYFHPRLPSYSAAVRQSQLPPYPTFGQPVVRPLVPAVPPATLQFVVPYAPPRPLPSQNHLEEIQKLVDKQAVSPEEKKPPVTGLGLLQDIHQAEQTLRFASKELRDLKGEIFSRDREVLNTKVRDGLLCTSVTLSGALEIIKKLQDIVDDVQGGNREFHS